MTNKPVWTDGTKTVLDPKLMIIGKPYFAKLAGETVAYVLRANGDLDAYRILTVEAPMHGRDYVPRGTFRPWKPAEHAMCPNCESGVVWYAIWDSSDGAYEDTQYECRNCGYRWWVEGDDA